MNMPSPITENTLGQRRNVEIGCDAALRLQGGEQLLEACVNVPIDRAIDLADLRIARRFEPDLEAHGALVRRLIDEVVVAELQLATA